MRALIGGHPPAGSQHPLRNVASAHSCLCGIAAAATWRYDRDRLEGQLGLSHRRRPQVKARDGWAAQLRQTPLLIDSATATPPRRHGPSLLRTGRIGGISRECASPLAPGRITQGHPLRQTGKPRSCRGRVAHPAPQGGSATGVAGGHRSLRLGAADGVALGGPPRRPEGGPPLGACQVHRPHVPPLVRHAHLQQRVPCTVTTAGRLDGPRQEAGTRQHRSWGRSSGWDPAITRPRAPEGAHLLMHVQAQGFMADV